MAFASRYIEKQVIFPVLIGEERHPELKMTYHFQAFIDLKDFFTRI